MACGCTKRNGAKEYVYTAPDNKKTTFRTEVEAKAAVVRQGGTSAPA